MDDKIHYLYVVAAIKNGVPVAPCKIGITHNLTSRLSGIQTGSPYKLEVISAIAIPGRKVVEAIEKAVHWQFEDFQMHGEWFDLSPVDAAIGCCTMVREAFLEIGMTEDQAHETLDNLGIVRAIRGCFEFIEKCRAQKLPLESRF